MKNVVAFVTLVNDKPVCYQVLGFKVRKDNFLVKISDREALDLGPFDEWHRRGGFLVREDHEIVSMIEFVELSRSISFGFHCSEAEKAKAEDVLAQCYLRQ